MTATELHELVRHWPREAWPEGVEYEVGESVSQDGSRLEPLWLMDMSGIVEEEREDWQGDVDPDDEPRMFAPTQYILLMFEASGLRWLLEHNLVVRKNDYTLVYQIGMWNHPIQWRSPTLIAAIAAAIKGAQA